MLNIKYNYYIALYLKTNIMKTQTVHRRLIGVLYIILIGLIVLSFTSCQFELNNPELECKEWNEGIDKEINDILGITDDVVCIKGNISKEQQQQIDYLRSLKCEL